LLGFVRAEPKTEIWSAIPYLEILLENLEFSKVSAVKKSRISQENDLIATENPGFKSF
jgi:hypothetical protein